MRNLKNKQMNKRNKRNRIQRTDGWLQEGREWEDGQLCESHMVFRLPPPQGAPHQIASHTPSTNPLLHPTHPASLLPTGDGVRKQENMHNWIYGDKRV